MCLTIVHFWKNFLMQQILIPSKESKAKDSPLLTNLPFWYVIFEVFTFILFLSLTLTKNCLQTFFLIYTGGTLGLFTGMSILSMVEIAFWVIKISSVYYKEMTKPRKIKMDDLIIIETTIFFQKSICNLEFQ